MEWQQSTRQKPYTRNRENMGGQMDKHARCICGHEAGEHEGLDRMCTLPQCRCMEFKPEQRKWKEEDR